MSEELFRAIVPVIVALLIVWLVYRIKLQVRRIFNDEFYNSFPSVRETVDKLEHRLKYLNAEIDALERKLNRLKNKD